MEKLFNNDRMRVAFLNATLFILFACVCLADAWPSLTLPAIGLGSLAVMGQAALLYRFARTAHLSREIGCEEARYAESFGLPSETPSDNLNKVQRPELVNAFVAGLIENRLSTSHQERILHRQHLMRLIHHARAPEASTWALASFNEESKLLGEATRRLSELNARSSAITELHKWKLVPQGDEAFAVKAGAFEIEHFHGKTNIRVLDPSRVTVEGEFRGSKGYVCDDVEIKVPIYQ